MVFDNYISLRGLLLHGFVSPGTGTQDGKLSVVSLRHTTWQGKLVETVACSMHSECGCPGRHPQATPQTRRATLSRLKGCLGCWLHQGYRGASKTIASVFNELITNLVQNLRSFY